MEIMFEQQNDDLSHSPEALDSAARRSGLATRWRTFVAGEIIPGAYRQSIIISDAPGIGKRMAVPYMFVRNGNDVWQPENAGFRHFPASLDSAASSSGLGVRRRARSRGEIMPGADRRSKIIPDAPRIGKRMAHEIFEAITTCARIGRAIDPFQVRTCCLLQTWLTLSQMASNKMPRLP